jgi:hypothetical protein
MGKLHPLVTFDWIAICAPLSPQIWEIARYQFRDAEKCHEVNCTSESKIFALGEVSHSTARLASGSRSAVVASPVAEKCKSTAERFGAGTKHTHTETISTLDTTNEAFIRCAHSA